MEDDNLNTIRLTYPNLDFGMNCEDIENSEFLAKNWDKDEYVSSHCKIGSLVPHILISSLKYPTCSTLRQLMAHVCLTQGHSPTFELL